MQQPSLAQYRVPVFRELAARPGIELRVVHAEVPELPNVEPEGFQTESVPMWRGRVFGRPLYWNRAHWGSGHARPRRRADHDVGPARHEPHSGARARPGVRRGRRSSGGMGIPRTKGSGARGRAGRSATLPMRCSFTTTPSPTGSSVKVLTRIVYSSQSTASIRCRCARHATNGSRARTNWRRFAGIMRWAMVRSCCSCRVSIRPTGSICSMHAVAVLSPRFPSLKAVLVGKGEPEGARIRGLAAQLGIADRILFAGPIYDEMALAPWFLCARPLLLSGEHRFEPVTCIWLRAARRHQ